MKSVTIPTPVTFNSNFICSLFILNTEKIDKTFEIKVDISSISSEKIRTTANMRINNTYSGLYDLRITEKHKYIKATNPIFKNIFID